MYQVSVLKKLNLGTTSPKGHPRTSWSATKICICAWCQTNAILLNTGFDSMIWFNDFKRKLPVHSLSLWQVQSAACSSEAPSDGSKWSSQLIVWLWSFDGWSSKNRNVLTENPISLPNEVWTTFNLFRVLTHRIIVTVIVTYRRDCQNSYLEKSKQTSPPNEWMGNIS